jgi:glycosyltransferase involved in cell wall biosynthesis
LREEKKVEFFASVAIGGGPRLEELRANLSSHLRSNLDQSESDQRQHKPPHLALGMLDHDAAVRVLAASDILLLPSRNEGIALAVYEAMALGVTPVVSAVGGQCELVSGGAGACLKVGVVEEEGMAVQKDAATPFVDELESLLRSPELLNKRKREARRRVEHEFTMRETMRALSRGLGCGVG